jgi:hypothetical protein
MPARCRYRQWAELMRLTLGPPVDTCAHCRGDFPRKSVAWGPGRKKLRALVRDRASIEHFLRHQGLWTEPGGRAEARPPPCFRSITRLEPTPKPSCSSRPSAPPQGRGLPAEGSLWDRLQVEGRGFNLACRYPIQVRPSPSLQPSHLPRTRPA